MLPEVFEAIQLLKANRVASERLLATDAGAYTGVEAAVETWERREALASDGLQAFAQRTAAHLAQVRSLAS